MARPSSLLSELADVLTNPKTYKYLVMLLLLVCLQGVVVYLAYKLDAVASAISGATCVVLPSNAKLLIALFGSAFFVLFAAAGAGEFVNVLNRNQASASTYAAHRRGALIYLGLASAIAVSLAGYIATWC